jgi:hypothetical protein
MSIVPAVASILDTKVSFEAAALLVTWAAMAFLTVIAIHLHLRLQRLERASAPLSGTRPYGHFAGRRLDELLGITFAVRPRLVVALSAACNSCERVLGEIAAPGWTTPTVVLWTDHTPSRLPALPANTIVVSDGPAVASKLGIRITPFALWIDQEGEIVKAAPINSLGYPQDNAARVQTAT